MKKLIFAVAILFAASSLALAGDEDVVAAAHPAATTWLSATDELQYEASWSAASSLFKAAVSQEDWEKSLGGARKPLGALKSRELDTAQFYKSLPGAPDGEYVVMTFNTSFENKKAAVETVTVMKDTDGAWRVSGYYIK